ncbi:MAG: TonB-dependent receptor [Pseudomonadota bacterium]
MPVLKNNKAKLRGSWRRSTAIGLALAPFVVGPIAPTPTMAEDKIVVTGSRILQSADAASQPVVQIDADAIALSGTATSLGNWLNDLPALGSNFSTAHSSRFVGTVGYNFLDLRDLGENRTLVLVDGKRHVAQDPGAAAVDINTIPTDLIERVEITTGGASAVYGADAVTGVVNLILKDEFEGLKLRGQWGRGGGDAFDTYFMSATAGARFDDDRGGAILSVEHSIREFLDGGEPENSTSIRGRTIECTPAVQARFGVPAGFDECAVGPGAGLGGFSVGGTFSAIGSPLWPGLVAPIDPDNDGVTQSNIPIYTFTQQGEVVLQNTSNLVSDFECFDCDFVDLVDVTPIQPRVERFNVNARFTYEIAPFATAYLDAKFVETDSFQEGQPSFDFLFTSLPIFADNHFATPSLQQFFFDAATPVIFVQRFNLDLGRRGEENETRTRRFVAGFEGEYDNPLFGETWTYDASFNYGRSKRTLVALNNRLNLNWFAAIDAVTAPGGGAECRVTQQLRDGLPLFLADGATLVSEELAANCVPVNIVGFNQITEEGEAFVNIDSVRTDINRQKVWSAHTGGPIFDVPAGAVDLVVGAEYRKEESSTTPAPEDAAGLTFGNQIQPQSGSFDVVEGFAEIRIPVLRDQQFAERLDVSAAVRYGDYSTIGGATAFKADALYQPVAGLAIRGGYSRAIRAPNINELFAPLEQTFVVATDPCSESEIVALEMAGTVEGAALAALRRTNCAALGRPDNFESLADDVALAGEIGGNPELLEERAHTWTIGAAFSPRAVQGLSLSLDYWNIHLDGGVGASPAQEILDLCVQSATGVDNQFCDQISRDPAFFEITNIRQVDLNFASIEAAGLDYEVSYQLDLNDAARALFGESDCDWGAITTRVLGTHYLKQVEYPFASAPDDPESFRGELGTPKNLFNADVVYRRGGVGLSYGLRFLGDQLIVDDEAFAANPTAQYPFRTGRAYYHDLALQFDIKQVARAQIGVDNLTNVLPADFLGVGTGVSASERAGSSIYDNIGRFVYAGIELGF